MLKDKNKDVRKGALFALDWLHDKRAVEPVIEILKDQDREVRKDAIRTLGRIGDKKTVTPIIAMLKDEDKGVRTEAVEALGRIGDTVALKYIINSLKDKEIQVRGKAESVLGGFKDSKSVDIFISLLKDDNNDVVEGVLGALGEIGKPIAVPHIIEKLKDENKYIKRKAVKLLGKIGDIRAVEPLIALLMQYEKDKHIILPVIDALGKIGDMRVIEPFFEKLKEENVRLKRKLTASQKISKGSTVDPMRTKIKRLEDEQVKSKILRQLENFKKKIKDTETVKAIDIALKDYKIERLKRQRAGTDFVKGEFLLKFKEEAYKRLNIHFKDEIAYTGIASIDEKNKKYGIRDIKNVFLRFHEDDDPFGLGRSYKFSIPKEADVASIVIDYMNDPSFEYVEPNYILYIDD